MNADMAGKTARQVPASFSNVCNVAMSVVELDAVTMTTCCALPTEASCCTRRADGAGVSADVRAGVGVGFEAGGGDCAARGDNVAALDEDAAGVLTAPALVAARGGADALALIGAMLATGLLAESLDGAPAPAVVARCDVQEASAMQRQPSATPVGRLTPELRKAPAARSRRTARVPPCQRCWRA